MDYKKKAPNSIHKKDHTHKWDTKVEENKEEDPNELKGPLFREFTIHIFESISFLQEIESI